MPNQLLRNAVRRSPERVALVCAGSRVTYRDLDDRARRVAAFLQAQGAGPGRRVAVILPNCLEFVELVFGCAAAGVALLPLDPLMPVGALAELLTRVRPDLVVSDAEGCNALRQRLSVDEAGPHMIDLARWPRLGDRDPARGEMGPEPEADAPAIYLCTSGSSGVPQQVCRTHRQLRIEADNFVSSAGLGPDDNFLCVLPLHHSYGLEICLLGAVAAGTTLVLLDAYDADRRRLKTPFVARCREVASLVGSESIRVLPAVPQQFLELARLPKDVPADFSSVKLVMSSASPLPGWVFERFRDRFGRSIRQSYGSSEAGTVTLNLEPEESLSPQSVGTPVCNVSLRIVDDRGEDCRCHEVGRIRIRSAVLERSAQHAGPAGGGTDKVQRDFDSGDLGYLDAAGRLYITQRASAIIDAGGYKVDPRRVEQVLLGHAAVHDAVVYAEPTEGIGDSVVAAVQLGSDCGLEALRAFCSARLAAFESPTRIDALDAIPRGPLGKVQLPELRRRVQAQRAAAGGGDKPQLASASQFGHLYDAAVVSSARRHGALLERIRAKVALLVDKPLAELPVDGRLQDLGFDSVRAAEFRVWLEECLGFQVPITVVWNSPTLSACAEALLEMTPTLEADAPASGDRTPRWDISRVLRAGDSVQERIEALGGFSDAELCDRLSVGRNRRGTS